MGLALRDHERHTYGDYLHWPDDVRYELIDGDAYLIAPAPTLDLVHPTDRVISVYRLNGSEYSKPEIYEMKGTTPVGVSIGWDDLAERLPKPEL